MWKTPTLFWHCTDAVSSLSLAELKKLCGAFGRRLQHFTQRHKCFILSKYHVYWNQQKRVIGFLSRSKTEIEWLSRVQLWIFFHCTVKYYSSTYINVLQMWSVVYCIYLQRWWREVPVYTLSHSEGGRRCQADHQETISSQHWPVSPTLLVLHARLGQDGNAEGDVTSATFPEII